MPIPFTCPHCGVQTNVDEQYAGQTGPCVSCGNPITVPLAGVPFAHVPPRKSPATLFITIVVVLAVVMVIGLVMVGLFATLLFPAMGTAGEAARRAQCTNNLKQIGLAMHNYHDRYKCFPPAVIADQAGRPVQSWRVAALPYLEQQRLYQQYDANEPWDGPNNRMLRGAVMPPYKCPSETSPTITDTSYVMIVGPGTLGGEPNQVVRLADVLDGTSNTILAIEVGASGIHWMEPRDLTVEEAVTLITNPAASPFQQIHPGGVNVLMADGSVRFLPGTTDPETVRALLLSSDQVMTR